MAYSKLFSSIVHSSLWTEEDHVRLLFVTLLAIADREGYVYGSRMGLERLANIDYDDDARNPWQALMDPDSDSSDLMRAPENEGRRIEEVPGGFRILNYSYYRSLRNDDDRREQNREAQQRYREKVSTSKPKSSQDKPASASVSQDKQSPSASASDSSYLSVLKERVRERFLQWISVRKAMGKKPKNWDSMFAEQVDWLVEHFNDADQLEVLSQSIRNNWQGLQPPKQIKGQRTRELEPAPTGQAYRIYEPPRP